MSVLTYEGGDAASADSGLEVALQLLLDGAGGVKALSQQDDGVDKEEGGNAVDDVLKYLDPEHAHTEKAGKDRVKRHFLVLRHSESWQILWVAGRLISVIVKIRTYTMVRVAWSLVTLEKWFPSMVRVPVSATWPQPQNRATPEKQRMVATREA